MLEIRNDGLRLRRASIASCAAFKRAAERRVHEEAESRAGHGSLREQQPVGHRHGEGGATGLDRGQLQAEKVANRGREVTAFERAAEEVEAGNSEELARVGVAPCLKHKIINTGARELKMTWTMTPPGLETYFRKIGRPRKAGEAPPAPFDPPKAADDIQRETGFGDLQR